MAKTGRESFKFMLRLPDELRDQLRNAAETSGRSVTGEIIHRLEGGLDRDEQGAFKVWLPADLLDRILQEANEAEVDPNLLIMGALERAYPAPTPTFGELVAKLAEACELPDSEASQETRDYLQAARLAIQADPRIAHRPMQMPATTRQPPRPHPWEGRR